MKLNLNTAEQRKKDQELCKMRSSEENKIQHKTMYKQR